MKKLFSLALLAIVIGACNTHPQFVVEGTVSDAADKVLYFEASAISGIQSLDSVKLNEMVSVESAEKFITLFSMRKR